MATCCWSTWMRPWSTPSYKEGAAGPLQGGLRFHLLAAVLDRDDGTAEPLAGILREGNIGQAKVAGTVAGYRSRASRAGASEERSRVGAAPLLGSWPALSYGMFTSTVQESRISVWSEVLLMM
jgi:hypothetical protein